MDNAMTQIIISSVVTLLVAVGDDWVGKYDYLEEQGVTVVYTPYGKGVSSSSLKKKIADNFEKLKRKTDNHLPIDAVEKARKGKEPLRERK